ncbi:MAG: MerR family DNA-binding protein [Coxiellaceae bacterium]|nr:MAG: MerR family DNA-binding protein [Coxiellaceae bacterium]
MVGFSLEEIKEFLSLQTRKQTTSQQIKALIQTKLDVVQTKMIALQNMHTALAQLIASCDGKVALQECPILETLYDDDMEKQNIKSGLKTKLAIKIRTEK